MLIVTFLFELHAGELIFISAWPVVCTNTLPDAIVVASAGATPHLLPFKTITVITQVWPEGKIPQEPGGSGSFVWHPTPAWERFWRWGRRSRATVHRPRGHSCRRGKPVKLHSWSRSPGLSPKWNQVVELRRPERGRWINYMFILITFLIISLFLCDVIFHLSIILFFAWFLISVFLHSCDARYHHGNNRPTVVQQILTMRSAVKEVESELLFGLRCEYTGSSGPWVGPGSGSFSAHSHTPSPAQHEVKSNRIFSREAPTVR